MSPTPERICRHLLVKLAARCNIDCAYCYWFRDATVYEASKRLTEEAQRRLLARIEEHVTEHDVPRFGIVLHGGEPLLFGRERFARLGADLRALEARLGFELDLSMTTNAMLLSPEWAQLLSDVGVRVTVSLDGPRRVHDGRRRDFRDQGTFDRVRAGIEVLRAAGIQPTFLAVCDPAADPRELATFFVDEIGARAFDVLVPDATHEDEPESIAPFYKGLFDTWYERYADRDVRIRFLNSIVKGLLGMPSGSDSIGYGPVRTVTMTTDGALEPLDVLRTARPGHTRSDLNVSTTALQDAHDHPLWREVHDASLHLADECEACVYRQACGGGHIASRWSEERRYDNPSVYCDDFKDLLGHVWGRIAPDLYVEAGDERLPLLDSC